MSENITGKKENEFSDNCKKNSNDDKTTVISSQKKRLHKRDKKMSANSRKNKKMLTYWEKEDKILASHIPYNSMSTRSPHILINKWFHRLSDNCIVLKKPREVGQCAKDRKIYYDIDRIGKNVQVSNKGKYLNLQLENTKHHWVMIVVKYKDIMTNPKLCFITESGFIIEEEKILSNDDGYVILAAIHRDVKLSDKKYTFSETELGLANKFFYNQTKGNQKDYHYQTSGTIHSFGYGAMYHTNHITGHTISKFATSKYNIKKTFLLSLLIQLIFSVFFIQKPNLKK